MRYLLFISMILGCGAGLATAQSLQTITFTQEMKIDELGDCDMTIDFKLNAKQYATWIQKYGQNKSLLKRDLSKLVSQYDTYDWRIDVREMERQVVVGLKAHGTVQHDGGGHYEFPVPKNWKGGSRNGQTLEYNYIESIGEGMVGQYQIKLDLPPSATDIKPDTGESGEPIVRYVVPADHSYGGTLLVLGIVFMVIGLGVTSLGVVGHRLPVLKDLMGHRE